MLKILSIKLTESRKGVVEVGGNSRAGRGGSKIVDDKVDDEIKVDDKVGKKGRNLSKSKNLFKSKKIELSFLTFGTKMVFTKLRQAFVKTPILHYFDLKCHIQIKTDASGYAISGVFS